MIPPEFFDLLSTLVQGDITPEQHARLEAILTADPEARRLYFDYLDLHLGLRQSHLAREEARPAEEMARRIRPRRRLPLIGAAAAAVIVAVVVATFVPHTSSADALLSRTAGARFYGASPTAALETGREYALVDGTVELLFRSGAGVILEAPAAFAVRGPLRLDLKYGKGSVRLESPGAQGFAVETPLTRVVDRGTRFALEVDEAGETEVQILDGAADVYPQAAGGATRLTRGSARRFSMNGSLVSSDATFNGSRFPLELPDRVVRYTATSRPGPGGVENLTSVTVRRGGREIVYPVDRLVGIDLVHFKTSKAGRNWIATVTGGAVPDGRARRALLDRDTNLNTGVINPGGSPTPLTTDPVMNDPEDPARPNTPGMAFRFQTPVVNDPGPDVVLFEFQPVIQPEHGDPFHVSPFHFAPGFRSMTVQRWDLGTYSPEALPLAGFRLNGFDGAPGSLSALEAARFRHGNNYTVPGKILAVGVDLSDLVYPPGARVEGLFLQDVQDDGHEVDPVFIAGLPPVGEGK
jgi:ferric-dicitrate binding protein FerR (iron transport regulator)